MKKVGIYVVYIEHCRILKIFPTFIAGSAGHGTQNKNQDPNK